MQLTTTLPIMRQHGQRDHTIFSWYGPENEQRLIGLVGLRMELQDYLVAELAKLSAAGRPLNRPLSYDFPGDAKTWVLAEVGLGAQNSPRPPGQKTQGGYVLHVMPCAEAPAMELTAKGQLRLTDQPTLCVDSHTATTACGWQRQCLVGWWPCEDGAAAHTWHRGTDKSGKPDSTLRNFRDCYSSDGEVCFQGANGGAQSGGEHCLQVVDHKSALESSSGDSGGAPPYIPHTMSDHCSATDTSVQWVFNADGKLESGHLEGMCLGAVAPPAVQGIDQYMVGDSMMAAPVLVAGARSRQVYFPAGASWRHHFTNKTYAGGETADVEAPLDHFPLFWRI
eukprot:SAG22_NODE_404_length_11005_cov_8.751788_7_plen_337_part_00